MSDIEKVIKGLEHCRLMCEGVSHNPCNGCPYQGYQGCFNCADKLKTDALELLKEYKRQDECPCTYCMEWECDEVCEEYKKWKDS